MTKEFPVITIILRGYSVETSIKIAEILNEYKCFALEVALNSERALESIKAIKDKKLDSLIVGAGTVITMKELDLAHDAGADFVLSPVVMTKEMLDYCSANNIISVPGAYSPSEINTMRQWGADVVKVFPANSININYFKAIQAPLGEMDLMAVGGVSPDNVETFLSNGLSKVGIGSGIGNKDDLESGNFNEFREIMEKLSKIERKNYE